MNLEVRWSEKAKEDLGHIYTYYSERSKAAADNLLLEIVQVASSIRFPEQYQIDPTSSNIEG